MRWRLLMEVSMSAATKPMRSPLRYPGGKQRTAPMIGSYFPVDAREYREPFIGGGSLLLWARQNRYYALHQVGDLNDDLHCFWSHLAYKPKATYHAAMKYVGRYDGPADSKCDEWQAFTAWLRGELQNEPPSVRFFVLNRSTNGGTGDSGGITMESYQKRFTANSCNALLNLSALADRTLFSCCDYKSLVELPGDSVFLFLDPPYQSAKSSGLYGKGGDLHRNFNHEELAQSLKVADSLGHRWLMTLDDTPEMRSLFESYSIKGWSQWYPMSGKVGREMLVSNYDLG